MPTKTTEAPTKVQWRNRYRDQVTLRRLSPTTWLFDCDSEVGWRFGEDFIDPSGGPFVRVGMSLRSLHRDLPDERITAVVFGVYDTDTSGYEYSGWLVHTTPNEAP